MTSSSSAQFVLFLGILCTAAVSPRLVCGQSLVPTAAGKTVQDSMGFQWDISTTGTITDGTNRGFQTAGHLMVGGSSFTPSKRSITADGSELVYEGTSAGVQVTRRVRVDFKNAVLRYVETFSNPRAAPITLDVRLVTSLRTSVSSVFTSSGQAVSSSGSSRVLNPATRSPFSSSNAPSPILGQNDCGLLVTRSSSSYPAVLFYLATPDSSIKPTLQRQGAYQFIFRYAVAVPPNQSVSIVHGLAQRNIRGTPSSAALATHFKPFLSRDFTRDLPLRVRRSIINSGRPAFSDETPGDLLASVKILAGRWGLERGDNDVLVQDEQTQLPGTVVGGDLKIETRFGKTTVPLDQVAMLIGGAGIGRTMRVFLRSGEVLVGNVETETMSLETQTGLEVKLTPRQIQVLFLRAKENDGSPPAKSLALIRTLQGDQLVVAKASATLRATTGWGIVETPMADIAYLYPVRDPQPIHRLILRDQSRLSVILEGGELELETARFGTIKLDTGAIARLTGVQALGEEAGADPAPENTAQEDEELTQPYCRLLGNNLVVGRLDAARLELRTGTGVTPLDTSLIILMERDSADDLNANPMFSFQLSNGTSLVGRFPQGVVPLAAMGKTWRIPAYHVVSFHRPEVQTLEKSLEIQDEKTPPPAAPADTDAPAAPAATDLTPVANNPFED